MAEVPVHSLHLFALFFSPLHVSCLRPRFVFCGTSLHLCPHWLCFRCAAKFKITKARALCWLHARNVLLSGPVGQWQFRLSGGLLRRGR